MTDSWDTIEPLYDGFDALARSTAGDNVTKAAAEDIVQKAFMELREKLERGERVKNPKGLLERIIHRRTQDYLRSVEDTHELVVAVTPLLREGYNPYDAAIFAADLDAGLRRLPHDEVQAFVLTELRGVDDREAGDILHVDHTTVSRRADRARRKLRKALA